MARVELVPTSEALRLWGLKDRRTLIKRAQLGIIKYDVHGNPENDKSRPTWFFETPQSRYNRIHNIK